MSDSQPKANDQPASASQALRALVQRGMKGDPTALSGIRMWLDTHPEIWREVCDVARNAEHAWIKLAAGNNLVLAESPHAAIPSTKSRPYGLGLLTARKDRD